jgi:hypothetical protein
MQTPQKSRLFETDAVVSYLGSMEAGPKENADDADAVPANDEVDFS